MSTTSTDVLHTLDEIAADPSKIGKEAKLRAALEDPLFRRVVVAAYDPYVTYGVKPRRAAAPGSFPFGMDDVQPWDALRRLADRVATGNVAADLVAQVYALSDAPAAELVWRVLNKDLRAGFTASTVNKARPGTVPTFDVMLAHPYEPKRVRSWPVACEPKLDGVRAIAIVRDGGATFYFRSGKPFDAISHLGGPFAEVVEASRAAALRYPKDRPGSPVMAAWARMLGGDDPHASCVIDGEVVTGSFLKTVGDVRRKGAQAEGAEFHAFDLLPLVPWLAGDETFEAPYRVRRAVVAFLAARGRPVGLFGLPFVQAADDAGVREAYEGHAGTTLASYLARGDAAREAEILPHTIDPRTGEPKRLEGTIAKPLDGPYRRKRDNGWLKIKGEITEDLPISGWFPGAEGTKLEGRFGGFLVDRAGVEVRVGGGFSDAQRDEFGRDPDAFLGRIVEVEAHEATPDGSLRHPRFVRLRPDKDEA